MKTGKTYPLFILLIFFATSHCNAYNKKPLYTVLESTGNGIVYMTDDKFYLNGDHTNTTSEIGKYSELRTIFSSSQEAYDSLKCYLYFHVKAEPGYGLVGFTETKHEDGIYQDKDFTLDINGAKAVSGSCIDVDDTNWPCIDTNSEDYDGDDSKYYSETPNKHYYAVFTEVPEFHIEDGIDINTIPTSPTGTHTVVYKRHLKAGWSAVYLPCEFNAEQFKATIEGSDVYMLWSYSKSINSIIYGVGMKQIPPCTPIIIYSPIDYDLEYVGTNHTVTTDDSIADSSVTTADENYHFAGTFTNRTFRGICYKVTSNGKEVMLTESDNHVSAFQFALVFDNEVLAPKSKRITFVSNTNDIQPLKGNNVISVGIYSLDGKLLNTETKKGVYIKNGKKIAQ